MFESGYQHAAEHEDALALCGGDRQQVLYAAVGGLMRRLRADRQRYRAKSNSTPTRFERVASTFGGQR